MGLRHRILSRRPLQLPRKGLLHEGVEESVELGERGLVVVFLGCYLIKYSFESLLQ